MSTESSDAPQRRGPANQYGRLYDMGEEKMRALEGYLLQEMSGEKIALIIQNEWGLYKDERTSTLTRQVNRYRDKVFKARVAAQMEELRKDLPDAAEAVRGMATTINVIEKLENAVLIQEKRIMKLWEKEQQMPNGLIMTALSKEWKAYLMMLERLGNFQMEMGLVKRAPKVTALVDAPLDDAAPEESQNTVTRSSLSRLLNLFGNDQRVIEGESKRVP